MVNVPPSSSTKKSSETLGDKKIGMNQMDLRFHRKQLSSKEKALLEKSTRRALQRSMSEKRKEKFSLVEENKSRISTRKAANIESVEKKQQEVQAKLEQNLHRRN